MVRKLKCLLARREHENQHVCVTERHNVVVTNGETYFGVCRAGAPVRLLDLSGTYLTHRSVIGSIQTYGLRPAAQRAGGSLQALILARCGLTPSAPAVACNDHLDALTHTRSVMVKQPRCMLVCRQHR